MQRWNWFLAADSAGRWITTNGYAEVELKLGALQARLCFSPDAEPYHVIEASIDESDDVDAVVTSPGRETPPFGLTGRLFRAVGDGRKSVLLTDGTTIIGLAYGPESHMDNL